MKTAIKFYTSDLGDGCVCVWNFNKVRTTEAKGLDALKFKPAVSGHSWDGCALLHQVPVSLTKAYLFDGLCTPMISHREVSRASVTCSSPKKDKAGAGALSFMSSISQLFLSSPERRSKMKLLMWEGHRHAELEVPTCNTRLALTPHW